MNNFIVKLFYSNCTYIANKMYKCISNQLIIPWVVSGV